MLLPGNSEIRGSQGGLLACLPPQNQKAFASTAGRVHEKCSWAPEGSPGCEPIRRGRLGTIKYVKDTYPTSTGEGCVQ